MNDVTQATVIKQAEHEEAVKDYTLVVPYRALLSDEIDMLAKIDARGRLSPALRNLYGAVAISDLQVAYTVDEGGKFTICSILRFDADNQTMPTIWQHFGATKRITYSPREDGYDYDTGRLIAFSKALSAQPIPFFRKGAWL